MLSIIKFKTGFYMLGTFILLIDLMVLFVLVFIAFIARNDRRKVSQYFSILLLNFCFGEIALIFWQLKIIFEYNIFFYYMDVFIIAHFFGLTGTIISMFKNGIIKDMRYWQVDRAASRNNAIFLMRAKKLATEINISNSEAQKLLSEIEKITFSNGNKRK